MRNHDTSMPIFSALALLVCHTASAAPLACLIEPEIVTELGTPVPGVVETIRVDRGDRVTRGQVLVSLLADVERAGVESAKARAAGVAESRAAGTAMTLAYQKLKRSEGLFAQGFISPLALDQVRSEYEVARQRYVQTQEQQRVASEELRVAHAQVGIRQLKSPIDGVVLDRYANPGERIELKPVMKLAKVDALRVEVVLPASQFGAFRPGDTALVTPDIPGGKALSARVVVVDRSVDAASNTFRVRLELPNRDRSLPASARCRIEFAGNPAAAPR